jgi:hypothetical protein
VISCRLSGPAELPKMPAPIDDTAASVTPVARTAAPTQPTTTSAVRRDLEPSATRLSIVRRWLRRG